MADDSGTDALVGLDRRRFLRRSAIAGTAIWALPSIVSIEPASAQAITSPAPEPPIDPPSDLGGTDLPSATATAPPPQVGGRTVLPETGAELDDLLYAGLAAIAGGAALRLWSFAIEEPPDAPRPR
jgi:hypothetical protein